MISASAASLSIGRAGLFFVAGNVVVWSSRSSSCPPKIEFDIVSGSAGALFFSGSGVIIENNTFEFDGNQSLDASTCSVVSFKRAQTLVRLSISHNRVTSRNVFPALASISNLIMFSGTQSDISNNTIALVTDRASYSPAYGSINLVRFPVAFSLKKDTWVTMNNNILSLCTPWSTPIKGIPRANELFTLSFDQLQRCWVFDCELGKNQLLRQQNVRLSDHGAESISNI